MSLEKITVQQMDAKGVCSAPDVLSGTPAQNKAVFDRMMRELFAPAYNAAVDAINAINQTESGIEAAEALRVSAENLRVQAETARIQAESGRVTAEQARVNAENLRVEAENLRQAAETARAQAESGRATAEQARESAEATRVANENQRIANENARIAAEQARVSETTGVVAQAAEQAEAAAESARLAAQAMLGQIPDGSFPESKLVAELQAAIDRAKAGGEIDITLANKAGWSQKNIAGSILDWALAQDEPITAYAQSADGVTDLPKDGYWLVELVMSNTNGRWKKLVLTSITTNESWYRIYNWSVWNAAWHRQYDDTNAYSKTEVEELMKAKRNWKGGIVTGGVSILDWAASQDTPTDCACDTTVTGVPYSGYWVVQLSIFPEAGWKTLVAKCILTGEVWSIGCNVGTWDAWRKLLDSATTKPSDIGAAPAYSYGTADLTAGVSALDTGKLYFVYE